MSPSPIVSIVIPTFNREIVLIETINSLIELEYRASEIIIVDQSIDHSEPVTIALEELHESGQILWLRLTTPSIPNAMNIGAMKASGDIVLYVDDDIVPSSNLVFEHANRYLDSEVSAVAGQVIQSWETALPAEHSSYRDGNERDPDAFQFNSSTATKVRRFIGCNVSFRRTKLLQAGGFDNNFTKVAYRFEAEAAERFVGHGNTIVFEPKASLKHLKQESGGTRSYGNHLTSLNPSHTIGMYYYYLVVKNQNKRWFKLFTSPFKACITKFHLRHPWYIPVTFLSNIGGIIGAIGLWLKGQRLLSKSDIHGACPESREDNVE